MEAPEYQVTIPPGVNEGEQFQAMLPDGTSRMLTAQDEGEGTMKVPRGAPQVRGRPQKAMNGRLGAQSER